MICYCVPNRESLAFRIWLVFSLAASAIGAALLLALH
jgi:hypothetical protein